MGNIWVQRCVQAWIMRSTTLPFLMPVMIYQRSAYSWINFCVCNYQWLTWLKSRWQLSNEPWGWYGLFCFIFSWFSIVFWVECILGLENSKAAMFLYLQIEREETSQSHDRQEWALILFEKGQNKYIHLNFRKIVGPSVCEGPSGLC